MNDFKKGVRFYWAQDLYCGGWSSFNAVHSDGSETPIICPQSQNDGDDGMAWFATVDDADEQGLADADRELIETAFTTATKLAEQGYDSIKVLELLPDIMDAMHGGEYGYSGEKFAEALLIKALLAKTDGVV